MISENERVDGSWELTIAIPDINDEVKVRVRGDIHVGGVMHKSVGSLENKIDWSDHMLWWPDKNIWLSHTRTTLDQYGVQSNSKLELIKVHNSLIVILPSLSQVSVTVNFSADIFSVVVRICKELCIRFPEELSLHLPLTKDDLKSNHRLMNVKSRLFTTQVSDNKPLIKEIPTPEPLSPTGNPSVLRYGTLTTNYGGTLTPVGTINKSMSSQIGLQSSNSLSFEGIEFLSYSDCMKVSAKSVFDSDILLRPKNIIQKARLNCAWLDSSSSLMEQGITADYKKPLHFRFKFHLFYDLNPKYDAVRIHQLFEQARWDLLSGRIGGSQDEFIVFAALQLQAELQTETSNVEEQNQPIKMGQDLSPIKMGQDLSPIKMGQDLSPTNGNEDEVEQMLTELEEACLGTDQSMVDGHLPPDQRFEGSLRVTKLNKLGIKTQKRLWCVLHRHQLNFYHSKDDSSEMIMEIIVPTCQIKSEVNVSLNKYFIRIITMAQRDEVRLQFDNKEDYSNWMAALRLVTRRKTLTNRILFQKELKSILDVLNLQSPSQKQSLLTKEELNERLRDLGDYIPEKIAKKARSKEYLRQRIGESHGHVLQLGVLESKLKYIQAWQRLENFGFSYVLVRFDGGNRDELIGIASNRLVFINQSTGDATTTHFYSDMRSWNINWDAEKVILDFKQTKLVFVPVSTNCKTVIELIGGYVFLNQRNPDKNQELNVKLFHKLTGVAL